MKFSEAREFLKEGMRLKVLSVAPRSSWLHTMGRECTLNYFSGRTGRGDTDIGMLGDNDELEILTEADGVTPWKDPRVKEQPKFKVGDRVRIVNRDSDNTTGGEDFYKPNGDVGETGFIHSESGNFSYHFRIEGKNGKYYGLFKSSDLELLPAEEPEEKSEDKKWYLIDPRAAGKMTRVLTGIDVGVEGRDHIMQVYYSIGDGSSEPAPKSKLFNRKESKMNSLIQSIKAKLSPVDKKLVKAGYLNPDGTQTDMYIQELKELAIRKLVDAEDTKEFRKEIADAIKD